jgi:uncharacterized protein
MIRILKSNDNESLVYFLSKEKELNLYILGDIEAFGYDSDFQVFWGEFNNECKLIAVLLKNYDNFIFYSRDNFDCLAFAQILKNENFYRLAGEKSIIEQFQNFLEYSSKSFGYLAKLNSDKLLIKNFQDKNIIPVLSGDAEDIVKLYNETEEFKGSYNVDKIKTRIENKIRRGYCIKENEKIVAIAQSTAENNLSAMIIGVCTHQSYRNKGYASICVSRICNELLHNGKTLCLTYTNPKAGSIYKKLGFEDIGEWITYIK